MISVIITSYNVERFLREAVDSALAQTHRDIEVIVVDDGSSDGSAEVVSGIADPRLRFVRVAHGGSALARNAGLQLASGELAAFLDGDDRWAERNLERQAAVMESHPELDLTFCHSLLIDEDGGSLGFKCSSRAGLISMADLLRTNEIGNGSCVLVRRTALDQAGWFDPSLQACIDIDVWLRIASLRPRNVLAIPEALTFYRRRQGQISGKWRRMEGAYLQLLEKLGALAPEIVRNEESRSRAGRYRYYARLARESGETGLALRLLATAFCWAPLWLLMDSRTWLVGAAVLAQLLLPRRMYHWALRRVALARARLS